METTSRVPVPCSCAVMLAGQVVTWPPTSARRRRLLAVQRPITRNSWPLDYYRQRFDLAIEC